LVLLSLVIAGPAFSQVQTIGNVSFAVPDGWQFQAAQGGGAMFLKQGANYWIISVHTPLSASGDANADFKAAWRSVVLSVPDFPGLPGSNPYDITKTLGYPGKVYENPSVSGKTYVRLYTLETGKGVIPVMVITINRQMLDMMDHVARAVVGSVRMAPLQASPIKSSITVNDLAGHCATSSATSLNFDNSSGQYQRSSLTGYSAGYTNTAEAAFTYRFSGLLNNRPTTYDDSGVIELGGEFVVLKGQGVPRASAS
jgi:hypothetical protein